MSVACCGRYYQFLVVWMLVLVLLVCVGLFLLFVCLFVPKSVFNSITQKKCFLWIHCIISSPVKNSILQVSQILSAKYAYKPWYNCICTNLKIKVLYKYSMSAFQHSFMQLSKRSVVNKVSGAKERKKRKKRVTVTVHSVF